MSESKTRKPLSEAPTDGTPILYYPTPHPGEDNLPIIIAYGEFEKGYCKVEKCSGGFYHIHDWSDFTALASYDGEWEEIPPVVAEWLRKNLSF